MIHDLKSEVSGDYGTALLILAEVLMFYHKALPNKKIDHFSFKGLDCKEKCMFSTRPLESLLSFILKLQCLSQMNYDKDIKCHSKRQIFFKGVPEQMTNI